jgi:hypothetical protein
MLQHIHNKEREKKYRHGVYKSITENYITSLEERERMEAKSSNGEVKKASEREGKKYKFSLNFERQQSNGESRLNGWRKHGS